MAAANFSDPEMQEIFEGYLVETNELLESLSQDLMELESNPEDLDLINRVFRSFHTIKGTSAFMGFDSITGITHHAEDILNKLRRNELTVTQPIIDVLLEVLDWIVLLVRNLQEGEDAKVDYSQTINELEKLKGGNPVTANAAPAISTPAENKVQETSQELNKTSSLDAVLNNHEMVTKPGDFSEDELLMIEAAFAEVNQGFWEDLSKSNNDSFTETELSEEAVSELEVIAEVPQTQLSLEPEISKDVSSNDSSDSDDNKPNETNNVKQVVAGIKGKPATSDTIRIDVNRVESLMDLSGELVLGRNRLAQITELLEQEFESKDRIRDLIETTAQVDFVTSEIQAAVMRMRMVPIGKLYQKAPRIVRDLSKEFGKKINLVVKGEETEIDRGIIEELNDPLVHMIRNSCDHGIESTEKRIAAGKSEQGTIILDAEQEGNNIVLRISDDGAGMDPEKLKAKALEKGIISQEQAMTMSNREAYQLIFMPGFSTAAKVSAVSGRGVGMDVVRTNIQNLKGMIDIESEIGVGTTFIIKLPLTLAIIQGLLVKVKNETYALPLSSVVEVVAIEQGSISTVNKQEVIRIRQEVIPMLRLDMTLGHTDLNNDLSNRYVVNVGLGIQRVGFVVDELLGQQEIVIKSLGEYLGSITGIAGSTILGDGRVIMILDVAELIQSVFKQTTLQF